MALATPATLVNAGPSGSMRSSYQAIISFPGDAAYATGGTAGFQAFARAALGHNATVQSVQDAGLNGGFVTRYDKVNDKLLVLQGDNDNVADGPLVEVSAATDLSATTFVLNVTAY